MLVSVEPAEIRSSYFISLTVVFVALAGIPLAMLAWSTGRAIGARETAPQGAAMLDTWGSDVIVGLFALLFGGTFRVFMLFAPPPQTRQQRREGETRLQVSRRQADQGAQLPRSTKLATLALYGLLAVICVSIAVSPVEMRWPAFAVGFLTGLATLEGIFRFARRSATVPPSPAS